ncbi:MAG: glutamine synthetase, type [Pedosphaera sp.]|nr:glutamine synthetase, type [Pedosphaera sp.]
MVDVKFVDTFGAWQHFSVPMGELTEEVFEEGFGFDGFSIRGWKSIEASDMLAMRDPATAFIDPFYAVSTLSLPAPLPKQEPRRPTIVIRVASPNEARSSLKPRAWPTPPSLVPKPSSSSTTTCRI